ncbi:hypothetical protein ACIBFB_12615 [Nocardiopsis sp. NPDC050513]|uniref:hypothetical protein n=1 Tax=Nocardiopsis sp. NPDC050513 TaxID=3364338 RepID=UPI0037B55DE8
MTNIKLSETQTHADGLHAAPITGRVVGVRYPEGPNREWALMVVLVTQSKKDGGTYQGEFKVWARETREIDQIVSRFRGHHNVGSWKPSGSHRVLIRPAAINAELDSRADRDAQLNITPASLRFNPSEAADLVRYDEDGIAVRDGLKDAAVIGKILGISYSDDPRKPWIRLQIGVAQLGKNGDRTIQKMKVWGPGDQYDEVKRLFPTHAKGGDWKVQGTPKIRIRPASLRGAATTFKGRRYADVVIGARSLEFDPPADADQVRIEAEV